MRRGVDGIQHQAHRNVLSAASAALKTLLCAPFREAEQIRQGQPIDIAASSGVVGAFLDYLYGGEPEVTSMDAVEVLRLAGAYGLPRLGASVESELRASLTSELALQLLPEALVLGLHDLQQACEEQIARDFEQCVLQEPFQELNAKQLQRILQREDLNVSREEVVVEALFKWAKSSQNRTEGMVLLLANVDFPSLSTSNLDLLRHAAQSLGSPGLHLECDIREAMAVHKKRSASDVACKHRPKRRCLARWSGGLGADKESDFDGRRVTPHVTGPGWRLVWYQGAFLLYDHLPGDRPGECSLEFRMVACKPGDPSFRVVAGEGACVNGFNKLQLLGVGHAVSSAGELFVVNRDIGTQSNQQHLLSFHDGVGKVLLEGLSGIFHLCGSPNGVLYSLKGKTQVQKLEGSAWTPLLSTGQLPTGQQEKFGSIFVSGQETLYVLQGKRVLRLLAGTSVPAVVADFGKAFKYAPASGFFVTEDETIFACSSDKRVFITQAGEASWNASLDVSNAGTPIDVLVQGQVLNVLAHQGGEGGGWENTRKSRAAVYQYALPRRLELGALAHLPAGVVDALA